jgi:WD40 repeat protein
MPAAGGDVPLPPGVLRRLGAAGMRHGAGVCGSALSPDGRLLATSSGRSVAVWDLAACRRVAFFPCDRWPHYRATRLAFSPDGQRLGYIHDSAFACVWDLGTGKEVRRFDKAGSDFVFCQFAAAGKQFALSDGNRIDFWDLTTGEVARAVRTGVNPRLLSPDGRLFLCIESNTSLGLFDSRTGEGKGRIQVDLLQGGIDKDFAFSPDSKRLAVVDRRKGVQVRDTLSGKSLASFPLPEAARYQFPGDGTTYREFSLAFSGDGATLLLGTKAGTVHRWDIVAKKELAPLEGHLDSVTGVHAPAGGNTVVSAGADGLIRTWDARTGRELARPEGYAGRVRAAQSPAASAAAVGDGSGRLELWDAAAGKRLRVLQESGPAVTGLAFTADGKVLAAAGADGKISTWSVATGRRGRTLVADGQKLRTVYSMGFSPEGRSLYVADIDHSTNRARLYETAGEKVLRLGASIRGDFSPDGKTIAASNGGLSIGGKPQGNLLFLDAATGATRLQVSVRPRPDDGFNGLTAVRYAPDGRSLAVGLPGGEVCLCDARTGAELKRFEAVIPRPVADPKWRAMLARERGASVSADCLAFSPDGGLLLTCGSDGGVRLWEAATGGKVLELAGHEGKTTYAAVTPDGRSALSCGEDGGVFVWGLRPAPTAGGRPTPESLWEDLGGNPPAAYRAAWQVGESARAVAHLRGKIRPAEPVGEDRLTRLIRDLGSDSHPVREAASKELAALGDRAVPALRRALGEKPEPEARLRIGRLLAATKAGPSAEELRELHAVRALELAGTAQAREALRHWGGGAAGARLTDAANAALGRLERRGTGGGEKSRR